MRLYSRWGRILSRIPIRLGFWFADFVSKFDHEWYMWLKLRLLRWAGMKFTGKPRYISAAVFFDDFDKVTMGHRVVISSHVSLLNHDYSYNTLLVAKGVNKDGDVAIVRPITIGNNVFIGRGALLMPGTEIGDNVIIAAGSVVRGKVESGSIMMGNPAVPITTVFELYDKQQTRKEQLDLRQDRVVWSPNW